jgi:hypothetical protein
MPSLTTKSEFCRPSETLEVVDSRGGGHDAVHKLPTASMKTCCATTHQHAPREWRDIHSHW